MLRPLLKAAMLCRCYDALAAHLRDLEAEVRALEAEEVSKGLPGGRKGL